MIIVMTVDARKIVSDMRKEIEAGDIDTWGIYDTNKFTHDVPQWDGKGWFTPNVYPDHLSFLCSLKKGMDVDERWTVYSIYHGRFIEMLIKHFGKRFRSATARVDRRYVEKGK